MRKLKLAVEWRDSSEVTHLVVCCSYHSNQLLPPGPAVTLLAVYPKVHTQNLHTYVIVALFIMAPKLETIMMAFSK